MLWIPNQHLCRPFTQKTFSPDTGTREINGLRSGVAKASLYRAGINETWSTSYDQEEKKNIPRGSETRGEETPFNIMVLFTGGWNHGPLILAKDERYCMMHGSLSYTPIQWSFGIDSGQVVEGNIISGTRSYSLILQVELRFLPVQRFPRFLRPPSNNKLPPGVKEFVNRCMHGPL